MDGLQRAPAGAFDHGFRFNSESPMDRTDECGMFRAGRNELGLNLGNFWKSCQWPDQFHIHELEFRRAAILPAGNSMTTDRKNHEC
jgi:hypothetical protein